MKTLNKILCSLLVLVSSCNAQEKKDATEEHLFTDRTQKEKNLSSKPDVRFKVNKQYDAKGNVISYDSTYSYSYSGHSGIDSDIKKLLSDVNSDFDSPMNFFKVPRLSIAPKDSTFRPLFKDEYFEKYRQMHQSLMDDFLRDFYSEQKLPAPDEKTEKKGQKKI